MVGKAGVKMVCLMLKEWISVYAIHDLYNLSFGIELLQIVLAAILSMKRTHVSEMHLKGNYHLYIKIGLNTYTQK